MDKYYILILLIIIIGIIIKYKTFEYFGSKVSDSKVCCLVEKKYTYDTNSYMGGKFQYDYIPSDCNNIIMDSNKQILVDGVNGWYDEYCKPNNYIGSCRNANKECIDFLTEPQCSKYKMTWSSKTCNEPLEYKWIDRTKKIDKLVGDGSYIMFDKVSKLKLNLN